MYRVFVHASGANACSYYRQILPVRHLRAELLDAGIEVTISNKLELNPTYDCFFFQRDVGPNFFPFLADLCLYQKKTVVWDMDDDLFRVPKWSPAYAGFERHGVKHGIMMALNWSSCITVATDHLGHALCGMVPEWEGKTFHLPNLIDPEDWAFPAERRDGPVRVLWAGSITHGEDLEIVVPALDEIISKYKDKIHVYFMGMMPDHFRFTVANAHRYRRLVTMLGTSELVYYADAVHALAPDVALMPLADCPFNHSKSNIKYLEMTMAGAACVASKITPYAETIAHGRDGLVVGDGDWTGAIESLVSSASNRSSLASAARKLVLADYSWQSSAAKQVWMDFFLSLPGLTPGA